MAIEDAFRSAMTVFVMFDAYVNTVAEKIGMERTVALVTKMCESMGAM